MEGIHESENYRLGPGVRLSRLVPRLSVWAGPGYKARRCPLVTWEMSFEI